jgi:hypothetical protein
MVKSLSIKQLAKAQQTFARDTEKNRVSVIIRRRIRRRRFADKFRILDGRERFHGAHKKGRLKLV